MTLDKIQEDEDEIRGCLRAVLSEWLGKATSSPTWDALADAVEELDLSIAIRIRCQYVGTMTMTPRAISKSL